MANLINTLNGLVWATPLILLTFGGAVLYSIVLKFCNIINIKLQWKLLKTGGGSQEGISPFETFCSVVAYRVAVGNIGGVMVANSVWRPWCCTMDAHYRPCDICYLLR